MPTPKMTQKEQQAYDEALKRIQDCLQQGEKGTALDLGGLGLTTLPPEIGQLTALASLYLFNNQLSSLPPEIGQLTTLTEFHLQDNQLSSLPPEIGQLTALNLLNIGSNQLSSLPPEIGQLAALTFLYLYSNQLSELPAEFCQLSALTQLSLGDNKFSSLPPEIVQLTALTQLTLYRNQISSLLPEIGKLTALRKLFLHNNPGLGIPAEVLGPMLHEIGDTNPAADPRAILDYYFRIKGVGAASPLNEFKLILVGYGAVGKTALVNRLIRSAFAETDMTRGIHIERWDVPAGADTLAAHVWDFGGQDIMHGTHQFFLTQRSLYVLVLAARESKQNEDAEYWLKTISAFGGNSPVIVVLNKADERPCEVNENGLRGKYPNIRGFLQTDCLSGRGIPELKTLISSEADQLEGVRAPFPTAWKAIKERISKMDENFLTFEKFREECAELGEPEGKGQEALAAVLHMLGIALNFRDDERLRETSVLNPLWVTGGIYSLLNDNVLARRHGELGMDDFKRVLSLRHYPDHTHKFLRDLMGKFELCFPLEGKVPRYLIPELLSEQEPDAAGPLDTDKALAFSYHYSKMLPHGLVPRLIVRLYQIIEDDLRWRTGAVFTWFNARALVKADPDDRCVRIRVHGSDKKRRRQLLGIIRQEFDELHRQFHGLLPREVIHLPDYPDVSVEYSHVEAAARAGMKTMPIFTDGNMIQVEPDLLLREFEIEGEERDAGNRGAFEVEPTPPPHHTLRRTRKERP